jgi:hypothetical protein
MLKRYKPVLILLLTFTIASIIILLIFLFSSIQKPNTEYTVSFETHGGTPVESIVLSEKGVDINDVLETKTTVRLGYFFLGWYTDAEFHYLFDYHTPIYDSVVLHAKWVDANFNFYTITWLNYDGSTLYTSSVLEFLIPIYLGPLPLKPSDDHNIYTFSGWSPTIAPVQGNQTYLALFDATVKTYPVTWEADGNILEIDQVEYGQTPVFQGSTPTKASTPQYDYIFNGWNITISAVADSQTYIAVFIPVLRSYEINWVVDDQVTDTQILNYGQTPIYSGITPSKDFTDQYEYTWSNNWTPDIQPVSGDITYTAIFISTLRTYTVYWEVNGSTIKTDLLVFYGTLPHYVGPTPTKVSTNLYDYTFSDWSPAISVVTQDITYVALFTQTTRLYTINWLNGSDVLQSSALAYDAFPTYQGPTPTLVPTAQFFYSFMGWTPSMHAVDGDATYTAIFTSTLRSYTISWEVNGTIVETDDNVDFGLTPTYNDSVALTKAADAQYTYSFLAWSPTIHNVDADITYVATFSSTLRTYNVTFLNYNGDILEDISAVAYGTTPSYSGATPTKPSDAQYTYTWNNNWNPTIHAVQGNQIYVATFNLTAILYTISWEINGVIAQNSSWAYGTTPSYSGATPLTRMEDEQYTYAFAGWSPSVEAVHSNQLYVALFTPTLQLYTVIWVVNLGTVEVDENVPYGATPSYDGETPLSKANDIQYTYTFAGWSPELAPVTQDQVYMAIFSTTLRSHLISWEVNGVVTDSQLVQYGQVPTYSGPTPTKPSDAQWIYTFNDVWSPSVIAVNGPQTYIALFSSTLRTFSVTWEANGSVYHQDTGVAYGSSVEVPSVDPTRASDYYSYTFTGWSPSLHVVISDQLYVALFDSTPITYTITWLDFDGTTLEEDEDVVFGSLPTFDGSNPSRTADAQYTYTWSGWSPSITLVTGDTTYIATYSGTIKTYVITWYNLTVVLENDASVAYGATPSYNGSTPTRASDAQFDYTFTGWSPAISNVVNNQNYYAVFTSTLRTYTITWEIEGTIVQSDENVAYGTIAAFNGDYPTKDDDESYTYYFVGWSPTITFITGDVNYVANFGMTEHLIVVQFLDFDDTVLSTQYIAFGEGASAPASPDSKGDDYWFTGWDEDFDYITGPLTVRALYSYVFIFSESSNQLTLIGYHDKGLTSITIPSAYEGKPVVALASNIFVDATSIITSISVPDSVTSIAGGALSTLNNLTSISIPFVGSNRNDSANVLNYIFNSALPSSVTSVAITSATRIPPSAFNGLTNLTEITMNSGITIIGTTAFSGATGLTSLVIPSGVTAIPQQMATGCSSLTSVTLPAGITNIDTLAFANCSNLSDINWPTSLNQISNNAFLNCSSLTSVVLPEGLTSVGTAAFSGSGLISIVFPSTFSGTLNNTFLNCTSLTNVVFSDGSSPSLASSTFSGCISLANIYIPNTSTNSMNSGYFSSSNVNIYTNYTSKPGVWFSGGYGTVTLHLGSSREYFFLTFGI